MSPRLYLEFCGEDWTLSDGASLSFGRCAELVIDDNPYLHRLVGRPVERLLAATRAVSEGDLTPRLPVRRSDELSQLAASFNEMTVHLAEARHQIYQSNKLASLGRLAAGIAHEINNPLGGLQNAVDVLQRDDLPAAKRLQYLELLSRGLGRIGPTDRAAHRLAPSSRLSRSG